MIELRTQQQLRTAQNLDFCCICGKSFTAGESPTRQHVPPKAIFDKADRTPPLILPAHEQCNNDQSPLDTLIAQLVGLLHGKQPTQRALRLDVNVFAGHDGNPTGGIKNLPLRPIIFRWVRCFHAALYRTYLEDCGENIFEPLTAGRIVNGTAQFEEITDGRAALTHAFKQQFKAGKTDGVICYNEKCHYRCTWLSFDNGMPFCLFALRLYNWEELGDPSQPRRGCVGWYPASVPSGASRGTGLELPISNDEPFDPFL